MNSERPLQEPLDKTCLNIAASRHGLCYGIIASIELDDYMCNSYAGFSAG